MTELSGLGAAVRGHIQQVQAVCGYLWERGWAERNGGNISVILCDAVESADVGWNGLAGDGDRFVADDRADASMAGMTLYVSGTGCRLRDLAVEPERYGCILRVSDRGGYEIVWGGTDEGFAPTSELISHLQMHRRAVEMGSGYRAIVHTHPIELICLTHHPTLAKDEAALNRLVWGMLPEVRVFVPKGCGLVPYVLPSSAALAEKTQALIGERDVMLWEKHGALAMGGDAMEAFDFLDVANKGATIALKCMAAGFEPEGMSAEQMDELERMFL